GLPRFGPGSWSRPSTKLRGHRAVHESLSLGGKFTMKKTLTSLAVVSLALASVITVVSGSAGAAAKHKPKIKPHTCYQLTTTALRKRTVKTKGCPSGWTLKKPNLQG